MRKPKSSKPVLLNPLEADGPVEPIDPVAAKELAQQRLLRNVIEGRDRAKRSIGALGKMREHDWFVRSGVEAVGNFALLADDAVERAFEAIQTYLEYPCSWCPERFEDAAQLQTHTLECSKRPAPIADWGELS